MNVIIHKPIKKHGHYLSRITTNNKNTIKLKIPYCILKHKMLLSNNHGLLIDIRVPENDFAMEMIQTIEKTCVNELIKNNSCWFDNALDDDKIPSLLESCVRDCNSLQIYSSHIRSSAISNGTVMGVTEWLETLKTDELTLTIVCDGMFIYPTKFGLRWVILQIKEADVQNDEIAPDIGELEIFWKAQTSQYLKELLDERTNLDKKISAIQELLDSFGKNNIQDLEVLVEKLKTLMNGGHFYKNILSEIGIV